VCIGAVDRLCEEHSVSEFGFPVSPACPPGPLCSVCLPSGAINCKACVCVCVHLCVCAMPKTIQMLKLRGSTDGSPTVISKTLCSGICRLATRAWGGLRVHFRRGFPMKGSGFPPGSPGSFQRSEAPSNTLSSAGHLVDRSDGVQDRPSPDHETRGRTNAMQQNWFSDLTKPNVVPEGAAVSRRRRATKACCQPGLHSAAENLVREPVDWGLWNGEGGGLPGGQPCLCRTGNVAGVYLGRGV